MQHCFWCKTRTSCLKKHITFWKLPCASFTGPVVLCWSFWLLHYIVVYCSFVLLSVCIDVWSWSRAYPLVGPNGPVPTHLSVNPRRLCMFICQELIFLLPCNTYHGMLSVRNKQQLFNFFSKKEWTQTNHCLIFVHKRVSCGRNVSAPSHLSALCPYLRLKEI